MPKSSMRSYIRSVNNIVVLSIFVAGMYCLYRYIKALETDIAKIREDMNGNQTICARPVPQNDGAVFVAAKKLEEANEIWGEDEDDDESIHSAELANMLRAVLSDASEEKANEPAYNVSIEEDTTMGSSSVEEDTTVEKLDTQEDPLPPLETHEVKALLAKKTNDELRTLLKERGSTNLKGNKAELIQRLLSE